MVSAAERNRYGRAKHLGKLIAGDLLIAGSRFQNGRFSRH